MVFMVFLVFWYIGILWYIMASYGILWYIMVCYGMLWHIMVLYNLRYVIGKIVVYYGILQYIVAQGLDKADTVGIC